MNVELIMKAAKQYEEQMIADRRKLHSCPGVGFDLNDTVAYVKAELTAMGYAPQDCGKAGVVALAGGKNQVKYFYCVQIWMHCLWRKNPVKILHLKTA